MGNRVSQRGRRVTSLLMGLVGIVAIAACQPLGPVTPTTVEAVRLPGVRAASAVYDNGAYYVYGQTRTLPGGTLLAPVTKLPDLEREYTSTEIDAATTDAMPNVPSFMGVQGLRTFQQNPTAAKFGNEWVMYFGTGDQFIASHPLPSCIARATASSPAGPFENARIVNCGPTDSGTLDGRLINAEWGGNGAGDPSLFTDADGGRWLQFSWPTTNWYSQPGVPGSQQIHTVRLDAAGVATGPVTQLLAPSVPWEGGYIGNPAMAYDRGKKSYLLAYTTFGSDSKVGIARCTTPVGPCVGDPDGPWLTSGNGRVLSGRFQFFVDRDGAQRANYGSQVGTDRTTEAQSIVYLRTEPTVTLSVVK